MFARAAGSGYEPSDVIQRGPRPSLSTELREGSDARKSKPLSMSAPRRSAPSSSAETLTEKRRRAVAAAKSTSMPRRYESWKDALESRGVSNASRSSLFTAILRSAERLCDNLPHPTERSEGG